LRTHNNIVELQNISFTQFIGGEWPRGSTITTHKAHLDCVIKFSLYEKKIENYVNVLGADNVYLIENETMLADRGRVVNDLLRRLGLRSLPEPVLSRQITEGVSKQPEDVTNNRQQFNESHASDYDRARRLSSATRKGID
jgi:hypothetical protein